MSTFSYVSSPSGVDGIRFIISRFIYVHVVLETKTGNNDASGGLD
ncbi:MAG TPA: hypothetical protein VH415_05125 [Nitrososphaeraceae archaeon]